MNDKDEFNPFLPDDNRHQQAPPPNFLAEEIEDRGPIGQF